jgi:hypothetical protein
VKHSSDLPQSATSLPEAPRDDAGRRFAKYAITMAIRTVCLLAMVLITPYGWYTWILGAAAIFLPYFAVVIANVGEDVVRTRAISPERAIEAPAPAPPVTVEHPSVIRISETPRIEPSTGDAR